MIVFKKKKILYFSVVFFAMVFISCGNSKTEINKSETETTENELSNEQSNHHVIIPGNVKVFNNSNSTIALPEPHIQGGVPNLEKLSLIDLDFYSRYIEPNPNIFREWTSRDKELIGIQSKNEDYSYEEIRHYFYAKIIQTDDIEHIWVVLYEYQHITYETGRLILLLIDNDGNLKTTQTIGRSEDGAGLKNYMYCTINGTTLTTHETSKRYDSVLSDDGIKSMFFVDSIVNVFSLTKNHEFKLSDTKEFHFKLEDD